MPEQTLDVADQLNRVADRLAAEFKESVPEEQVRALVRDASTSFSSAHVTQFVPVLVDRSVRDRLRHGG